MHFFHRRLLALVAPASRPRPPRPCAPSHSQSPPAYSHRRSHSAARAIGETLRSRSPDLLDRRAHSVHTPASDIANPSCAALSPAYPPLRTLRFLAVPFH